jgi:uncharacterized RDD family membrane protein YckC
MRCPKCHYISFDNSERCRNCGYEFSLSVDVAALDLPIQTGDEALGPLSDFSLADRDTETAPPPAPPSFDTPVPPTPALVARQDTPAEPPPPRRPATSATDLPLFKDRALDDDAPLVTPPAVPRMPLAVRRSNPVLSRAQRTAVEEPELGLELPDEPEHEDAPVPPPSRAAVASALAHPVAGIAPRVLAGVVDLAILGSIDAAVLYFTLKICGFSQSELFLLPMTPLVAFLVLLNGGYFVAFVAAGGQTIGKMAAGIKVVPTDGDAYWSDRVPLGTAFVRAAASLVSLAPAGAGYLPALLAADRRAVHDRLAHTRVVKA